MMKKLRALPLILATFASSQLQAAPVQLHIKGKTYEAQLKPGLRLEQVNGQLKSPRFMAFAQGGDLIVGSQVGLVYRLAPPYAKAETLIDFGGYPHSVAFRTTERGEELWLAETTGLYRTIYQKGRGYKKSDFQLVAPLPGGPGHNSRTVAVGPDKKIYVALGIAGNCSEQYLDDSFPFENRRGGVFVLDESSAKPALKAFASGLRNPVGLAWDPISSVLYATNNGPDHLGFDRPREIFVSIQKGDFFGMPWYQTLEKGIERDSCAKSRPPRPASDVKAAVATLPARSAPLGLAFARSSDLGGLLGGKAVIAVHGSWGTPPDGTAWGNSGGRRAPSLVLVSSSAQDASPEDLASGFQDSKGNRWLRPAGVAFGPDGSLYFTSDSDQEGLYRISINPH